MQPIDWAIVALILISTAVSLLRGFVKEALSLATWVAATLIAYMFGAQVSTLLIDHIETPSLRLAAGSAILFFGTLIVGGLVARLARELLKVTGLAGGDRILGMGFGLARGVLIVLVGILLIELTPVAQDPWWQQSLLIPQFADAVSWLKQTWSDVSGSLTGVSVPVKET